MKRSHDGIATMTLNSMELVNCDKQECIPVGCVPTAAVAIRGGGGGRGLSAGEWGFYLDIPMGRTPGKHPLADPLYTIPLGQNNKQV